MPDIQTAGWDVQITDKHHIARNMVESQDFHVGLALFDNQTNNHLPEDDLTCTNLSMKWIALLPADCMQCDDVSRIIRQHFYDFHTLPIDIERLLPTLGHAYGMASMWAKEVPRNEVYPGEEEMVGTSPVMQSLFTRLRKVAGVDVPILITGESGTGKELAARAIHERSSRSNGPFVAVNCGALPSTLIQSELFGYEKGAFTGATQRKIGRIESASGGTILLDEIGDLPLDMQVNLLRFLQEKTIERVGATNLVNVDVRFIAATHINLEEAVRKGQFREDLFYRLHVIDIEMPPVRERHDDIELLARFFFKKFSADKNPIVQGFAHDALKSFIQSIATTRIEGNSFSNASGMLAINQISGFANSQANSATITIGIQGEQIADSVLAGTAPNTAGPVTLEKNSKSRRDVSINETAFQNASGVVQLNQTAGSHNDSANNFTLRFL